MLILIKTTFSTFTSGSNAGDGKGDTWRVSLGGTENASNQVELDVPSNFGTQVLASGDSIGQSPIFALTLASRVYYISGTSLFFSALEDPEEFEAQGIGSGFIDMSNQYSDPESVNGLASYQGKLAVFGRRNTLIWQIDSNPANFKLAQILPNIGTVSPNSVQAVGDMDVYALADNGVRSLWVRDASNNAVISDIGTPIDKTLQAVLTTLTDAQKARSCAIVEPSSNRYWCFVPNTADTDNGVGKIYVFSYFPGSQIAAWSTYSPSYQLAIAAPAANYTASIVTYTGLTVGKRYAWTPGAHETKIVCGSATVTGIGSFVATATTAVVTGTGATVTFTGALAVTTYFTPKKFVTLLGQVYVMGEDGAVYQFGGADGNTYENCGVDAQTPYIDNGSPATIKQFNSIDAGFQGTWQIGVSLDYYTQLFKQVYSNTQSSFRLGRIGYSGSGTHYSLQFTESGNGYALLGMAAMHIAGQGAEK